MGKTWKVVGIVGILTIISKLLGFLREAVVATYFGTSMESDAYFIASSVPTLLFTAIGGAISLGIVPLYMELKEKDKKEANDMVRIVGTVFFGIAVVALVFCFLFTKQLVYLIAPGFTGEKAELTIQLTQIMLPSLLFLVLSSVSTGILHAKKDFTLPSMATIPYNGFIILSAVLFASVYGVVGLAYGTLLGVIGQFFIQIKPFFTEKLTPTFQWKEHKEKIMKSLTMITPIIIGSVFIQFNQFIDRNIASGLPEGSVSALNYANRLMWLPLSIGIMSLITVLFPSIVDKTKEGADAFLSYITKGFKIVLFISIPIAVVMMVERVELVRIVFQRGEFNSEATTLTSQAFFFYSLAMVFIGTREYLNRCILAVQNAKSMMYISILTVIINVIGSVTLSKYFAHSGLALATAIAMAFQSLLILGILWKTQKPSAAIMKKFGIDMLKYTVLFVGVFLLGEGVKQMLPNVSDIVGVIIMTTIVGISYLGLAVLFKLEEIQFGIQKLKAFKK